MKELFWKRSWEAMNELYRNAKERTLQDHALMANSLRIQGKWAEAVPILEKWSGKFPPSVRPYALMTLLLGYEKTGRPQEALTLSETLWKSAPKELRYYVALAQYRLTKDAGPAKAGRALERILTSADTKDRKIYALTRLVELPGKRTEQALRLLKLQANNKAAASALEKLPKPWDPATATALGVFSHLQGDDKKAVERLKTVPPTAPQGRKAAYYRAWSLSRLKRETEALNLWGELALQGNGYAESSVRRISVLAKGSKKKEATAVLERIVRTRKGAVRAKALLSLISLTDKKNAETKALLEDQVLRAYPDTRYAFDVLWARGWRALGRGDAAEAVKLWKMADAPGKDTARRARILYWLAHAERAAGREKDAERTLSLMTRRYPLSIYSFIAGRPLTLKEGENSSLASSPEPLEEWGFVLYARLKLQGPKASARQLYRSLKLARWLGLEDTYSQARRLETLLTAGPTLYRFDLEALYPRPYGAQVEKACKAYGVEDHLVWAVMRQESAFRPKATSWAGASGLMQLMPGTAKGEAKRMGLKKYDIYDVADNIQMGTSHLAWLAKSFSRADWIMAAYNAGAGNARKWLKDGKNALDLDRWIEEVRFNETCNYVQRVSANLEVYRLLYGEPPEDEVPVTEDESALEEELVFSE